MFKSFREGLIVFSLLILLVLVSIEASSAPKTSQALHCSQKNEMGTPFKMCVFSKADDGERVKKDFLHGFRILREIDSWMSEWKPQTELSRVNSLAGKSPVELKPELFSVLQYAMNVAENSHGAFDPTFNVFWGLYNFKKGKYREPSEKEIEERLPLIDYKKIRLDAQKKTAFLSEKGMKLGLGGLGQGFGVDRVVDFLKKKYSAGYVDGSGDTYYWGRKPGGELWTTGIRDPRNHSKRIGRIYGTDFAITTCGDDEKFFINKAGEKIHHIIDPETGRPAKLSRQVTVIAKTTMAADAYDTAGFVLGPDKGKALIEKLGMEAVFVDSNGQVHMTSGLKKKTSKWGDYIKVTSELRE